MTTSDPKCNHCGGELAMQVSPGSDTPPAYYCPNPHAAPQAAAISFDRLGDLFDLHQEHARLLREQQRQIDAGRADRTRAKGAVIEIHYAHGASQRVGAEPVEASQFMAWTIERRLDGIEQKMAALGVTDIKRELPGRGSEHYEDLDDEIPF